MLRTWVSGVLFLAIIILLPEGIVPTVWKKWQTWMASRGTGGTGSPVTAIPSEPEEALAPEAGEG